MLKIVLVAILLLSGVKSEEEFIDDLGSYYNQLQNIQNNPNYVPKVIITRPQATATITSQPIFITTTTTNPFILPTATLQPPVIVPTTTIIPPINIVPPVIVPDNNALDVPQVVPPDIPIVTVAPAPVPTPAPTVAPVPDQSNCNVQTCDQTVTGRQLPYGRALQIVQEEQYLEEVDLDIIRRRRVKRQVGVTFMNFFGGASATSFCNQIASSPTPLNVLASNNCNAVCMFPGGGCSGTNFYTGNSASYALLTDCIFGLVTEATSFCATTTTTTTETTTTSNDTFLEE